MGLPSAIDTHSEVKVSYEIKKHREFSRVGRRRLIIHDFKKWKEIACIPLGTEIQFECWQQPSCRPADIALPQVSSLCQPFCFLGDRFRRLTTATMAANLIYI